MAAVGQHGGCTIKFRSRFGWPAGGKIYAIGGENVNHDEEATVEAFDPQLGSWAEVASMSVKRCYHALAVVDGKIYAIGGYYSHAISRSDSAEAYDPQADRWQQVANMPQGRFRHAAAVMGGKIYVSGGDDGNGPLRTVVVFDPQANTWTGVASMGTERCSHASAAVGGKLYVFGGETVGAGRTASVEAYDPISNRWAEVTDLAHERDDLLAVAL